MGSNYSFVCVIIKPLSGIFGLVPVAGWLVILTLSPSQDNYEDKLASAMINSQVNRKESIITHKKIDVIVNKQSITK